MRQLLAFLLAIALSAFAGTPPVNTFNSSAHPSKLYGFVIEDDPDFGDDGYKTMMVMSRTATSLPWERWDNVAVFSFPPPGKFSEWAAARIETVNVRVKALTGDPSASPAIAIPPDTPTPATWLEMKAWFLANTHWAGSWLAYGKPEAPPTAPPDAPAITHQVGWTRVPFGLNRSIAFGVFRKSDGRFELEVRLVHGDGASEPITIAPVNIPTQEGTPR